tara:strand:- start:6336 stop:7457 length:1122 start_codon:yes stop_codon:yes gene_type:complete
LDTAKTTETQASQTQQNIEPKLNIVKKKRETNLKSLGEYNREVSKQLDKKIFKRDPKRLKYFALYYPVIAVCMYVVMATEASLIFKILSGVLMGMSLAGTTFLGHEILHGSVVKNKKWQQFFGFLGFAPFMISPTYWRFWHNNLHHGNAQLLYKDPDAFPTKMVWKKSKYMQRVFKLSPGSGYLRSYLYFFYWFSLQAFMNQAWMRFGNKMWDKMNHKKVTIEFGIQVALFVGFLTFIGVENWLWLFVIPFMVMNYTVMSYISTNHNISPYTKINDPLVNSLSVKNNRFLEWFNLNFGYHTEHHLFPAMPMTRAKEVSKKLQEMYPDRYQIMPKHKAVKLLYSTPRIYKNRDTLINPETGAEYSTLGAEKIIQ